MANLDAKRTNYAKQQASAKDVAKFNQGLGEATARQNPTDTHKAGTHHTSDTGARDGE